MKVSKYNLPKVPFTSNMLPETNFDVTDLSTTQNREHKHTHIVVKPKHISLRSELKLYDFE